MRVGFKMQTSAAEAATWSNAMRQQ